ncbi:MAG: hypothetical protein U9N79_03145 [Actinomycetota bacterium]|nr:hypothetical protein [Actinomycetota bacterium]
MRIALDHTSEIGVRAGRLLLGEEDLDLLGVVRRDVVDKDRRIRRIDDIAGFDAVVTDDPDSAIVDEAATAGVPCVLWADSLDRRADAESLPLLLGANLVSGIGESLANREADIAGPTARVLFAWTEPGKPLRHGEPLTFPDPVGARWGTRRRMTNRRLDVAAPVPDEWAGIIVRSTTDETIRTLGIADLAVHLEAISLASGAVLVASGLVPSGSHRPDETADAYLDAALRIGLDIASFTESS